ncbi:MAG: copper resistance protein CopC [Actinomycetes bacterium]
MSMRGGRWTALAAVFFYLVVAFAPSAYAHDELVRSDPPEGGTVAVGRSEISLWFTGGVVPDVGGFALRDLEGNSVDVAVQEIEGGFVGLKTESLPRAAYQLEWQVVSSDGHPTSGAITFGVGIRPPLGADAAAQGPGSLDLVVRWIDLLALMLVIGALVVTWRVLSPVADRFIGVIGSADEAPRRRVRRLAAGASAVAVFAGVATAVIRSPRGDNSLPTLIGSLMGTLTGTSWGQLWAARELALALATVCLVAWARSARRRYAQAAAVCLVPVVVIGAVAGHSSTLPTWSPMAAAASGAHLVGAGIWVGGLVVLVLSVVPLMRSNPDRRGPMLSTVWRLFSPLAAFATLLVIASGLYLTGRHVPALSDLTSTSYGEGLTAKVLLMVGALLLAALNTMLVNPRLAGPLQRLLGMQAGWSPVSLGRFAVVVTAEAVILVVAVGAAAWVTSVPTSREVALAGEVSAPQTVSADGLFVSFEEVGVGPEQSRLIVRARSIEKTSDQPIAAVDATLVAPAGPVVTAALTETEPGRYEAETGRLTAGDWLITVDVDRSGLSTTSVPIVLTVDPPDGDAPPTLEVVLVVVAGLLGACAVGVLGVAFFASRRRRPTPSEVGTVVTVDEAQRT